MAGLEIFTMTTGEETGITCIPREMGGSAQVRVRKPDLPVDGRASRKLSASPDIVDDVSRTGARDRSMDEMYPLHCLELAGISGFTAHRSPGGLSMGVCVSIQGKNLVSSKFGRSRGNVYLEMLEEGDRRSIAARTRISGGGIHYNYVADCTGGNNRVGTKATQGIELSTQALTSSTPAAERQVPVNSSRHHSADNDDFPQHQEQEKRPDLENPDYHNLPFLLLLIPHSPNPGPCHLLISILSVITV
ncbi:hypothetical protein RRG08_023848 [Elysia crispata]|uniref:Uncharacterized protein n=1 Tax=Elysia crispata TaxID=231223 RepID=A0AAE1E4S6_9GAST|nr:hypothetical protein RRG08_023848 [Elysia crispata]